MNRWLKIVGWIAAGIVLLWVVFKLVGLLLAVLSWMIKVAVSVAIVAVVLLGAYYLLSRWLASGDHSGSTTEPERVFE